MSSDEIWNAWQDFVPALKIGKEQPILQKIAQLRNDGTKIFPREHEYFYALKHCLPQNISVIILGQDPYHKEGQAHGLAFSVQEQTPPPPSLRNIFKEIHNDVYAKHEHMPNPSPNLTRLATQGVLLLNTILSVEEAKPLSHAHLGWQEITKSILQSLAHGPNPLVVLLWGKPAQAYTSTFNSTKHLILHAAHPSPLSAHRGFFGCKHFSMTNDWLLKHNIKPIVW